MKLIVCERWTMELPERSGDEWFLDWVLKSPHQRSTAAGWAAYQALALAQPEMDSAVEYFGGVGAQSLMIQELWSPLVHVAMDYTPESAAHLATLSGVVAQQRDSYAPGSYVAGADLVALDFGDFTVWKTREGEKHRELIDRVFAGEPKGVVLTDVACRYLHLHRARYETLLGPGRCSSYPEYLEALSDRLEDLYGYVMVGGYWHGRWSSVMALAPPGTAPRRTFAPAPEQPVGLRVLP